MTVVEKFKEHEILPDVVSQSPAQKLHVAYGSHVVDLGNELTPTQVRHKPKVNFEAAEDGAFYTLVMTDPDAPSRKNPKFREWHHWLIVNIPGNQFETGDVLSQYVGSGPPQETGLHRYVFLLFKQPGKIRDSDHGYLSDRSSEKRGGWSTAKFAAKHNLGNPVAGNFYQAEWDDYVPKLYQQLSG